jgi:hypothetical protein
MQPVAKTRVRRPAAFATQTGVAKSRQAPCFQQTGRPRRHILCRHKPPDSRKFAQPHLNLTAKLADCYSD